MRKSQIIKLLIIVIIIYLILWIINIMRVFYYNYTLGSPLFWQQIVFEEANPMMILEEWVNYVEEQKRNDPVLNLAMKKIRQDNQNIIDEQREEFIRSSLR